jgi:hypothetical protein
MKGMLQNMKKRLSSEKIPSMGDPGSPPGGGARGATDPTPRADVTLPRRERRSSIMRNQKIQALKDLPALKDTSSQKREALFQQKLQLCSVMFNFDDPNSDKRGKDLKRTTLLELVDYVNNASGQKQIFTEALMPDIMQMVVSVHLPLFPPPSSSDASHCVFSVCVFVCLNYGIIVVLFFIVTFVWT